MIFMENRKEKFVKFNFTLYKYQTILPIRENLIREIFMEIAKLKIFNRENLQSYDKLPLISKIKMVVDVKLSSTSVSTRYS